jgi:HEAT repeat protein
MLWWNLRQLKSQKPETRKQATQKLGFSKSARVVKYLIAALEDKDSAVQEAATEALERIRETFATAVRDRRWWVRVDTVKTLGQIGDARAVEPLLRLLKDYPKDKKDWFYVHKEAIFALGQIGDARAVESLIALSKSSNRFIVLRETAAEALGKIGDACAIEALIALLNDPCIELRKIAAEALGKIDDTRTVELLMVFLDEHKYVWDQVSEATAALVRIGNQSVGPLIAILMEKDASPQKLATAARTLGQIGDSRAVEPLLAILNDKKDFHVQHAVACALERLGDARAVEPLITLLKDNNNDLRKAAARTLGMLKDKRAVEPLLRLLDDKEKSVREVTSYALGQIGDSRAVESLITVFKNKDNEGYLKEAAACALGMLGDAHGIKWIVEESSRDCCWDGERIVGKLELILKNGANRIAATELHTLARLSDIYSTEYPANPDADPHFTSISCSTVRELARQELLSRGLIDSSEDILAKFNTDIRTRSYQNIFLVLLYISIFISFYMLLGYFIYVISKLIF